jgi:hypothetical protein
MPYKAEISRKNPGCFLFLLDQSGSMEDPFGGGDGGRKKADELATIVNKLIHNLSIRCAKSDAIYDYFHVGVLGYGQDTVVQPALGGALSGRDLVPISELADNPLRIEDRTRKVDDGAGGLVEQTVKFPVWFEPKWAGGTPMTGALRAAADIVQRWVSEHPKGFPPIVINLTDGEPTDGDPQPEAEALCSLGTDDGAVLLFNIHLSSSPGKPVELPSQPDGLPDEFAKALFAMSSPLTAFMIGRAKELGMAAEDGARGFVFNAQPVQVIQFLDIGTRPANLR